MRAGSLGTELVSRDFQNFNAAARRVLQHSETIISTLQPDQVTNDTARWHHSGLFMMLRLGSEDPHDSQIRLQIWKTQQRELVLEAHAHPFHLASKVITGSYIEYLPELVQSTRGSHEIVRRYFADGSNDSIFEESVSRVTVDVGSPGVYEPDMVHTLEAGSFHVALDAVEPAVTLAVMGRRLSDHADTARLHGHALPHIYTQLTEADMRYMQTVVEELIK